MLVAPVKSITIVLLAVLLAGCGQEILVFDGTRYAPQDSTHGPIPGDPDGDRLILTSCTPDPQIEFFPTTLIEPTLALAIRPGCNAFFEVAPHDFVSTSSQTYRISWLGHGEAAKITPVFAGTNDNSIATFEFLDNDVIEYRLPSNTDTTDFAVMTSGGAAHRVLVSNVRGSFSRIDVRAESFDEGELGNDAVEFEMLKPNNALNLSGLLIVVPSNSSAPYLIADVFITIDRN